MRSLASAVVLESSVRCLDVWPRLRAPLASCHNAIFCIINRQGEPPIGSYFWPERRNEGPWFGVKFCFDGSVEAHVTYASGLLTLGIPMEGR